MTKELRLVIPINSLGYGMHAMAHYKALIECAKVDIKLEPIGNTSSCDTILKELEISKDRFKKDLNRSISGNAPSFILWHPEQLGNHLGKGLNVGATLFETDKLMPNELKGVQSVDKVVTYSEWAVKVLAKHKIEASKIVGPCIPSYTNTYERIRQFDLLDLPIGEDKVILSPGKWEKRKGHPDFVKDITELSKTKYFSVFAFWNNIFTGGLAQPVQCLIDNGWKLTGQYSRHGTVIYSYSHEHATLYLFGHLSSHEDLMSLYKRADIMVSYSSGEGWDLPCVDAIYMQCKVIATNNTAHLEYNKYFATRLPCHEEIADDGIWFKRNRGNWYPSDYHYRLMALERLLNIDPQIDLKKNSQSIASFCSLDNISQSIMDICFS